MMIILLLSSVILHFATSFDYTDNKHEMPLVYDDPVEHKQTESQFINKLYSRSPLNIKVDTVRHDKWGREIVINPDQNSELITMPQYPIDCTNERECDAMEEESNNEEVIVAEPTFKPFSQEELNKFLKEYSLKYGKHPNGDSSTHKISNVYVEDPLNILEKTKEPPAVQDKSKSWHLINSQVHNHPYDDHEGWVTLEPVPWSSSQVQKWEPNPSNKPQDHWDQIETHWNRPQSHWQKPESHYNKPESQYNKPESHYNKPESHWNKPESQWTKPESQWNKPNKWQDRPWNKPSYEYKPTSKPQHWNNNQQSWNSNSNNKPQWQSNWNSNPDIITDGSPSEFPNHESHNSHWSSSSHSQRPPTEIVYQGHHGQQDGHPTSYPSEGNGQWVLLSSTKGYSYPNRNRAYQRSLTMSASPTSTLSSHRSVKLIVLPALNGTTNTTTSHGGLLEVEKTFLTVDESQREHAAKMMKLDEHQNNTEEDSTVAPSASRRSGAAIRVYPLQGSNAKSNSKAVLAAVGAGMVPATMAMLLPMVLGRKKRSIPSELIDEFRKLRELKINLRKKL